MVDAKLDPFLSFNTAGNPDANLDPFSDLANLRLSQDFIESAGVKKLLTTVPVRKPHKHDFIRVRPEPAHRDVFGLIQHGTDRDYYLVPPAMAGALAGEYHPHMLYTCINRQGTPFFWAVRLPGPDGRTMDWWRSAHEAAEHATKKWVRISPNQDLGAYEILLAAGQMSEPEWPDHNFQSLLRIAFLNRIIDRPDHEVIQKLRGLA